ncbi:ATP-dependent RNA helicase supv3l1, mitochondrial [Globomyces sp. JEL0801]|nr:ATP-dependent RNA helicase supv3l1, mitochondrial [Globomyces sp. JEL0801]
MLFKRQFNLPLASSHVRWRTSGSKSRKPSNGNQTNQKSFSIPKLNNAKNQFADKVQEFDRFMDHLKKSPFLSRNATRVGIPKHIFLEASEKFSNSLKETNQDMIVSRETLLNQYLGCSSEKGGLQRIVLPHLYKFIQDNYADQLPIKFDSLMTLSDLRSPPEWYPQARAIKRKIIMHVGPTNSGKTYHALNRFKEARTGVYAGPLRLLAHEVYEKLNMEGINCNLLTGEERKESDGVFKWASTVEMTNISMPLEVCVIDEIQMIGDDQRGWAWTQAFLGVQASEVHLCGEESAVPLIKRLCESTEEELEIKKYKRLTGLAVDKQHLNNNIKNVQPGDCIMGFSRKSVFALKQEIEEETGLRAAVIYGSLPPETRAEQARLFNEANNDYPILVASDAIGMGLNLNIRRIVFDTFLKFNGKDMAYLSVSQAKQISGRAGRYKTQWEDGLVTTIEKRDFERLKTYLDSSIPNIAAAGITPSVDVIEKFSKVLPNDTISNLLLKFQELSTLDGAYFFCNLEDLFSIADLLENIPMSIRNKYLFLQAPVNVRDETVSKAIRHFAVQFSKQTPCLLSESRGLISEPKAFYTSKSLQALEVDHRIIILYLWLSIRFPEAFPDIEYAKILKKEKENAINSALMSIGFRKKRPKKHDKEQFKKPQLEGGNQDKIDHSNQKLIKNVKSSPIESNWTKSTEQLKLNDTSESNDTVIDRRDMY